MTLALNSGRSVSALSDCCFARSYGGLSLEAVGTLAPRTFPPPTASSVPVKDLRIPALTPSSFPRLSLAASPAATTAMPHNTKRADLRKCTTQASHTSPTNVEHFGAHGRTNSMARKAPNAMAVQWTQKRDTALGFGTRLVGTADHPQTLITRPVPRRCVAKESQCHIIPS